MAQRKVRIKDIADLAGVSIGTVDRVLHERGEVAEETRKRVMHIAEDLHYTPDLIAKSLKSRKNIRLVALLPEPTEENIFWKNHQAGISRAIKDIAPLPLETEILLFDYFSESDFRQRCNDILDHPPEGLIFAPVFKKQSLDFTGRLSEMGIPFNLIDSQLDDAGYLSFTGEDAKRSGRVAANLVDMCLPPGKDILLINFARDLEDTHHLNLRTVGFNDYFNSMGAEKSIRRISLTIEATDSLTVTGKMDSVMRTNSCIGAIFVTGSRSYRIAEYLCENYPEPVILVGYDIHEKNIRYLKKGCIKFLLGQRPAEQSFKGVKKLFDFLYLGRSPQKDEFLPVDIITSENVDDFTGEY